MKLSGFTNKPVGPVGLVLAALFVIGFLVWCGVMLSIRTGGFDIEAGLIAAAVVVAGIIAVQVAGWLLLFFPAVLVHEAGHWVAGRLLGYRLYKFAVWPFVWDVAPKSKFWIDWKSSNYTGFGYVVMYPDAWPIKAGGQVLYLLGGLAANAVMALACIALAQTWSVWYIGAIAPGFFLLSAVLSLADRKAKTHDLPRVVELIKQPSEASALFAARKAFFLVANGSRPTEEDWQEALRLNEHPALRLWLYLTSAKVSIVSERRARFQKFEVLFRDAAVADLMPSLWEYAMQAAHFALVPLCDRETAKRLMPAGDPPGEIDSQRLKALQLLLMTSEKAPGVDKAWEDFLETLPTAAPRPDLDMTFLNYARFGLMPLLADSETLARQLMDGVRPRDWDQREFGELISLNRQGNFGAFVHLMAYFWHMDFARKREARVAVEHGRELLQEVDEPNGMISDQLTLEAAFLLAIYDRDPDAASKTIAELPEEPALRVERLRTEAAIAMAHGSVESARGMVSQAAEILRSSPNDYAVREDSLDLLDLVTRMHSE